MATALLSAFASTLFVFILSAHCSRVTEDHSESCIQLKVSKFSRSITELSKEKQEQGSH